MLRGVGVRVPLSAQRSLFEGLLFRCPFGENKRKLIVYHRFAKVSANSPNRKPKAFRNKLAGARKGAEPKMNSMAPIFSRITTGGFRQEVYAQCHSNPETQNQHKERAMGTNKLAIQVNERLNEFRVKIIDSHLNFSIRSAESQRSPRCRRARFVRRCGRIPINSQKCGAFRF